MNTRWELDEGIKSIKSAWQREHTARANLEKMLENAEAENAKLRELVCDMWEGYNDPRCEECHLKDTPTCADCPICAREASVIDRMIDIGPNVTAYANRTDTTLDVSLRGFTPEQAAAATLGPGTCHVASKPCDMWECECGKAWWHGGMPNYCPNCGRTVIVE